MKFKTTLAPIKKDVIITTARVDHNDADYNECTVTWEKEEFDELFHFFKLVGTLVGEHHKLDEYFDENEVNDELSDLFCKLLPYSEDYGNVTCGSNSYGHTLDDLKVTYYDSEGVAHIVDLSSPLE